MTLAVCVILIDKTTKSTPAWDRKRGCSKLTINNNVNMNNILVNIFLVVNEH